MTEGSSAYYPSMVREFYANYAAISYRKGKSPKVELDVLDQVPIQNVNG